MCRAARPGSPLAPARGSWLSVGQALGLRRPLRPPGRRRTEGPPQHTALPHVTGIRYRTSERGYLVRFTERFHQSRGSAARPAPRFLPRETDGTFFGHKVLLAENTPLTISRLRPVFYPGGGIHTILAIQRRLNEPRRPKRPGTPVLQTTLRPERTQQVVENKRHVSRVLWTVHCGATPTSSRRRLHAPTAPMASHKPFIPNEPTKSLKTKDRPIKTNPFSKPTPFSDTHGWARAQAWVNLKS